MQLSGVLWQVYSHVSMFIRAHAVGFLWQVMLPANLDLAPEEGRLAGVHKSGGVTLHAALKRPVSLTLNNMINDDLVCKSQVFDIFLNT